MNKKRFRHSHLALAVCAAAVTLSEQSAAATSSTDGRILEESVVTASRTQERVFDSSSSLSVINEQELARSTAPSLAELMRDLPGVQVTDSGQPGLGRIRIRGEESYRVAVLIDGQEITDQTTLHVLRYSN